MAAPRDGVPLIADASAERFRRARSLFHVALPMASGARGAYLDAACGGDAALAADVSSLLTSSGSGAEPLDGALHRDVLALYGEPPRTIGPYTLVREIGRGGMGTVYLARRRAARVAIKLASRGRDGTVALRRFRAESRILGGLVHPNIARRLDAGATEDGRPYFVMEYVDGTHLLEYARDARLSRAERLRVFRTVCDAVSHAHAARVVHLDIKPGNILVTRGGVPKLLDFGLARLLGARGAASRTTARMLTPEFASPEQACGTGVTAASDVYSLGVLLHLLLLGTPPRADVNPRRLGKELGAIVGRALQPELGRRYASAEELSGALRGVTRRTRGGRPPASPR